MSPVYRSPTARSAAAATTPARLAHEFGQVLWREDPDGEIEVATVRDGHVELYRVHDDGSTTLLESAPPPPGRRWGMPVLLAGALLSIASIASVAASDSDASGPVTHVQGALFIAGTALFLIGAAARFRAGDLRSRVKTLQARGGAWHEPTTLHGWAPRASEQLSAVERIADEHDGLAFVRDLGARTADVVAMRDGRFERYWVDELGRAELVDSKPASPRYFVDKVLKVILLTLWIGFAVLLAQVRDHKAVLVTGVLAGTAVVMLAGWINARANTLEQRVKRLGEDGEPWLEIRTRAPDPD